MAINTRNKRFSLLGLAVPMMAVLPLADGTIIQADRQQFAYSYAGLLFDESNLVTLNLHTTKTSSLTATRTTRSLMPTRTSGAI